MLVTEQGGNWSDLRWLTDVESNATTSPAALVMAAASAPTAGARPVV